MTQSRPNLPKLSSWSAGENHSPTGEADGGGRYEVTFTFDDADAVSAWAAWLIENDWK